jgi:hypothetical protein
MCVLRPLDNTSRTHICVLRPLKVKSMLMCFFDIDGIVHKEFFPPGQTVSEEFCCDVLRRLGEDMRRKHPVAHERPGTPQWTAYGLHYAGIFG